MFWLANHEGLLSNSSLEQSVHAGLRTRLTGEINKEDDTAQNWRRFSADDIDIVGTQGIIDGIMETLGTESPVYLSVILMYSTPRLPQARGRLKLEAGPLGSSSGFSGGLRA